MGFVAAIDASKAFDKVNRLLLYIILYKKIGHTLTTSLMKYYAQSSAYIIMNGICSDVFYTTIGVKQGGPLSPRLFALYIEHLITVIDDSNLGIKIGQMIVNILLYADDIVLLANTRSELQKMIDLVERFGNGLEIKFNPMKTNFISVNTHIKKNQTLNKKDNTILKINGVNISNGNVKTE
jgi:hypothetical protein